MTEGTSTIRQPLLGGAQRITETVWDATTGTLHSETITYEYDPHNRLQMLAVIRDHWRRRRNLR